MPTHEELLHKEKLSLMMYMKNRNCVFHRDTYPNPKKDASVSTSLRKQGNVLYTRLRNSIGQLCESNVHIEAWNKYTESILYAPNDSEELALGYGNRSAMMFYLCAFEECIVECDRAISITSSNCLKFKLLCRKAESLSHLEIPAKEACDNALELLASLNLEATKKENYRIHIRAMSISSYLVSLEPKKSSKKNYTDTLMNFERSEKVPLASKSVAIQYNKKWGRHIVATEDIPAGKIIAVEKDFFTYKNSGLNCIYCNNCKKDLVLRSSLPCEHCIYNIYCSESCRKEAWDKYHQFQCSITRFLKSIESIKGTSESALKFILLTIHQVGGIEQVKQQLAEIENMDDPRMKGLSDEIFQEGSLINFFSLEHCEEKGLENKTRFTYLENSCLCAYLLAKYTDFFGEKVNLLETKMFLNEKVLFIAALFLRFYYTSHRNMHVVMFKDNKTESFGYYAPFGSLFNHSCDPNVMQLVKSSIIYFTRYPVQKGFQLFLDYDENMFYCKDKDSRQKDLQKKYNFICDCRACAENWSSICLPLLKTALTITPALRTSVPRDTEIILSKALSKYGLLTEFKPKVAKKVLYNMKLLSKNFTVYCEDYFLLIAYLDMLYCAAFFDSQINPFKVSFCESLFQMF